MSYNSCNNIKKYAAFIFMVFTVLSGSSDGIGDDSFVKAGRKALFFMQDAKFSINQSASGASVNDNEDLRVFIDIISEDSGLSYVQAYVLLVLTAVFFINNMILKNSIWKNAVF